MIDADCDWDEEDIATAIAQAQQVERWDKEAAKQLMAQARAAKAKLHEGAASLQEPFDAMRTKARLLLRYQGGISHSDLARMDYREVFGYIREAELATEEEQEAYNRARHGQTGDIGAALSEFERPQTYEGETVRLV